MSTIAIDWSGAKKPRGKIWTAVAAEGELTEVSAAAGRDEAIDRLLDHLERDPTAVGGMDFAFSMPAWFLAAHGLSTAIEWWPVVKREGERWLDRCEPPFWGRPGKKKPELPEHLRRTERLVAAVGGITPKSVFQIGGAGAVVT